jgi:hypothetical protein
MVTIVMRDALTQARTSTIPNSDQVNSTRLDHKKRNKVVCDHCKKLGHVKKNYFELVIIILIGSSRDKVIITTSTWLTITRRSKTGLTSHLPQKGYHQLPYMLMSATKGPHEASSLGGTEGEKHLTTPWITASGATNHMTGSSRHFSSYTPQLGRDRVRIAGRSSAPIMGCGTVNCASSLPLSLILHVPNFPENLLSVSSIMKSLKLWSLV